MNKMISSITKGPRQSNFELLRIVSMLFVLILHADFFVNEIPTPEEYFATPVSSLTRIGIEFIAIVAVNVFILISGWFGIRSSLKGFCNFIFQCLYFYCIVYLLLLLSGYADLSVRNILTIFTFGGEKEWFIKTYIGLYILSPVLNSFVETASRRNFLVVLLSALVFEVIFGYSGLMPTLKKGYSIWAFICLYLLARYVRLYCQDSKIHRVGGTIFISCCVINILLFVSQYYTDIHLGLTAYDNPLNILGALGLVLYFNSIRIRTNKFINFISASCFAAYLLHYNSLFMKIVYAPVMRNLFGDYSGIECLVIMLCAILVVFIAAILLDQPRKILWRYIKKKFFVN